MMTVPVTTTASAFVPGTPRKLFEVRYQGGEPVRTFDVTPDGRRFLMVERLEEVPTPPVELVLVQNWEEELKRLVPTR
jgi:hypothetical protein